MNESESLVKRLEELIASATLVDIKEVSKTVKLSKDELSVTQYANLVISISTRLKQLIKGQSGSSEIR